MKNTAVMILILVFAACGLFHPVRGPIKKEVDFKGKGVLLFSVEIPHRIRVEKSYLIAFNRTTKAIVKIPFIGTIAPGNAVKRIFIFPAYDWKIKKKKEEAVYVSAHAVILPFGRYRIKKIIFEIDSRYNYKLKKIDLLKKIFLVKSNEFQIFANKPIYGGRFFVFRRLPGPKGPLSVKYTFKVTDNYRNDRSLFFKKYKSIDITGIKTAIIYLSLKK